MKWLDNLLGRFGYRPAKPARRSASYAAAELSRLTASLRGDTEFINNTLRYELRTLRARSREAMQNQPYGRRFVQMCVDNIAGPVPFKMEGNVRNRSNKPDTEANKKIEQAWADFCKKGQCEFSGRWSMAAFIRLVVRIWATDGEVLIRILRGREYGPFALKLQLIDTDRLWEQKNESLKDGSAIHMGVEVDAAGTPRAYHITKRKPSMWASGYQPMESERIPAEDIIHLYMADFAEQVRGVPWMYAALLNLVHMGAFQEAAVINARVGASQMGFITAPEGTEPVKDGEDAQGVAEFDAEPGQFRYLREGETVDGWNPQFPDAAVEPFCKALLRGVAAGLGVSYHSLANDLESVNFSSARIGLGDERGYWMMLQHFFVEHFLDPFACNTWMPQAIATGQLPFDIQQREKYARFYFQPRRWQYIDPLKEAQANVLAIRHRLTSRTRVTAEAGDDFQDIVAEQAVEADLLEANNLDPVEAEAATPAATGSAKPAAAPEDDTEPAEPAKPGKKTKHKGPKPWDA